MPSFCGLNIQAEPSSFSTAKPADDIACRMSDQEISPGKSSLSDVWKRVVKVS